MRDRRRADGAQVGFIFCRECFEPLPLDPERMEKIGGELLIPCESCRNMIRIRRSDLRAGRLSRSQGGHTSGEA